MGELSPEDRKRISRVEGELADLHTRINETQQNIDKLNDDLKWIDAIRKRGTGERLLIEVDTKRTASAQDTRIKLRKEKLLLEQLYSAIRTKVRELNRVKEKLGTD